MHSHSLVGVSAHRYEGLPFRKAVTVRDRLKIGLGIGVGLGSVQSLFSV